MTELQKQYIDQNHNQEPISVMVTDTGLTYLEILTYYKEMGYEPRKKRSRRHERKTPVGYFDIDNYKPETI
jgi:hypothetical protein